MYFSNSGFTNRHLSVADREEVTRSARGCSTTAGVSTSVDGTAVYAVSEFSKVLNPSKDDCGGKRNQYASGMISGRICEQSI